MFFLEHVNADGLLASVLSRFDSNPSSFREIRNYQHESLGLNTYSGLRTSCTSGIVLSLLLAYAEALSSFVVIILLAEKQLKLSL